MLSLRLLLIFNTIILIKCVRVRVTYSSQAPSSLPNGIFHEIRNITYLDARIADKSFSEPQYVINLEEITYRKELNEREIVSFYTFRNLQLVSMINNGQKTMPNFRDLPKLKKVQIKKTNISEIGSNNVGMTPVEVLDFQENQIDTIGKGAFGKKVHSIDLKCNKLTKIEANWFKNASNIDWLNFESNQIMTLQENLFKKFKGLTELYLGKNFITRLEPGSISGPRYLNTLDLGVNDIQNLDSNVFNNDEVFIENFKINFNRFSFFSVQLTEKVAVTNSSLIYGNPWQCPCLKSILDWLPVNTRFIVPHEASCIYTRDFSKDCIYNENINTELYNTFISSYALVESRQCQPNVNIDEEKKIGKHPAIIGEFDERII